MDGGTDFDDVFVAGQHLPVALVAGADAAALAFEFADFHRGDGGDVHFGDLAEGRGNVPVEAGFGGTGVAAKEGFDAVFAFAHGVNAAAEPADEGDGEDEQDEFAGEAVGSGVAAVAAVVATAAARVAAQQFVEEFVEVGWLVVVFVVVVVAPGVLCHRNRLRFVPVEVAEQEGEHGLRVPLFTVCLNGFGVQGGDYTLIVFGGSAFHAGQGAAIGCRPGRCVLPVRRVRRRGRHAARLRAGRGAASRFFRRF